MSAFGTFTAKFFRGLPALLCVVCAALFLYPVHTVRAAQIIEEPRSDAPMGDATASFSKRSFTIGNGIDKRVQTYYWLSPRPAGAKDAKFPLVVVLHDLRGKAYAAQELASGGMPDNFPAYVLVPQSPEGKEWARPEFYSDTPAYRYEPQRESLPDVITMLYKLLGEDSIDKERIYIIGCGDGGAGVYGALLRYPALFAGGVVIGSKWSVDDAPDLTEVPLVIEHGDADDVVPAQIAHLMADQIRDNGGSVSYAEFPRTGRDCANPDFYQQEMWAWLFKQKKTADPKADAGQ